MNETTKRETKTGTKVPRTPLPERPANVRVGDFLEVATGFNEEQAVIEAQRCLQCKKPLCVQGCPVGINIPEFIRHIAVGDFAAGARRIKQDTNLPAICGRVCPQETQCENLCILGKKHQPVAIGALERFVADHDRACGAAAPAAAKPTGKNVAVVGAGPAGLTAAGELARMGHKVTVYEALHDAGGVLVYGIPEFRLPKDIVRSEVDCLKEMGVEFRMNVVVGQSLTVDELFASGVDAVFVGTGAGLPHFMNIPGENLSGVYTANEFLTRMNLMKAYRFPEYHTPVYVGKRVVVFGGGNTAMDAARTALRMKPDFVKLIYRRSEEEMPARREEIHHGKDEGIDFMMLAAPLEFIGDENQWVRAVKLVRMELGEPDASGRRRPQPIPGSEEILEVDMAIVAIGNGPNRLIPLTTPGLETTRHGTIVADEKTGLTSRRAVFAGGDVVTGAATVIQAMGAGKASAEAIDGYLTSDASAEAQREVEERLGRLYGASDRSDAERIAALKSLGVAEPEQLLDRNLPHWRARLDELLDPESVDMMPVHASHAHVRYIRGAIQELPRQARARLFRSKLDRTGLVSALKALYRDATGADLPESFEVHSVDLLDDLRQSTRVVIYDGGRRFTCDMTRMNPEAEVIFAGVASAVGANRCAAVSFTTPRGDSVALVEVRQGQALTGPDGLSQEFLRAQWPDVVRSLARQEALADVMGVVLRADSYVFDSAEARIYGASHLELFRYVRESERAEQPVLAEILPLALPDDADRAADVRVGVLKEYEEHYVAQWEAIKTAWPAVRDYLTEQSSLVEAYTGKPAAETMATLFDVVGRRPLVHLTRMYEQHLGDDWATAAEDVWRWRRDRSS